ncbi:hypothetical protein [Anaerobaca lacustris]|uniref:Uncharacterized protein n=1 Tax=Anaerobaca lacustris TaxID=3044600 RepID=A0AAW6TQC6_9BACT|nr:hypothetical protein [Sedimentisphaerales bacterium M17dextr]
MRTPRYESRTLAAGARARIGAWGKFITVLNISASTILMGVDDDPPQQIVAGLQFPIEASYERIELLNAGGVAATVQLYIADSPVLIASDSLIVAMVASLANIEAGLVPGATMTQSDHNPVAQTGVGSTQILAANPARKWALVTADLTNAGNLYLGPTNAVTDVADTFFGMMAGGSWREQYTGAVWAASENGTEIAHAYEIT